MNRPLIPQTHMAALQHNPRCARCAFPEPNLEPKSYALALLVGNQDVAALWARELCQSTLAPMPPLHTFCATCRQSAWVAHRDTAQEALVAHLVEGQTWSEVWRNLHAAEGADQA